MDEVTTFIDGGSLPCLLVENKADLLEGGEQENYEELKEFAKEGEFCGFFRTSAKTGLNINESMEYLIKNIIKRFEDAKQNPNEAIIEGNNKGGNNKKLNREKHNSKAQKDKGGCC